MRGSEIIETAKQQAARGELTPDELKVMFEKYGMETVIDGDHQELN